MKMKNQIKSYEEMICINNTIHRVLNKKTKFLKRFRTFCGIKIKQPDWIATVANMDLSDYGFCKYCRAANID